MKKSLLLIILLVMVFSSTAVMAGSDDAWVTVGANSPELKYTGWWSSIPQGKATPHNSAVKFTFEGEAIRWIGSRGKQMGKANVYLDGKLIKTVDTYSNKIEKNQVIFSKEGLTPGKHTIKVFATGEGQGRTTYVLVSAFQYVPTLNKAIELTKDFINSSFVGQPKPGDNLTSYYPVDDVNTCKRKIKQAEFINSISGISNRLVRSTVASINQARKELKESVVNIVFPDKTGQEDTSIYSGAPLWTKGKIGNAIKLNGQDDRMVVPHSKSLMPTEAFTIEAWINATEWKNNHWEGTIVGKDGDERDGASGYVLRTGNNGVVSFVATTNGWTEVKTKPILKKGRWYHVAAVFDGQEKSMKIFIDGELTAKRLVKKSTINPSSFNVYIGESGAFHGRVFNGLIDEVRIWNKARKGDEIKADYSKELTGAEEGLVGYWTFDELK